MYQLWSPSIEGRVHGRELGQHVVADVAVEHVATGELLLVLGRVELGRGVDDVQLGIGAEVLEHAGGGLAAERADLDDPPPRRWRRGPER